MAICTIKVLCGSSLATESKLLGQCDHRRLKTSYSDFQSFGTFFSLSKSMFCLVPRLLNILFFLPRNAPSP